MMRAGELTLERAEFEIGIPVQEWEGDCYAIASRIVFDCGLAGRAVYGHWTGPVSPAGFWADRAGLPFQRHGWIALSEHEGDDRVLDPTRWSFEAADPYLYLGPPDAYDLGGNVFRHQNERPCPPVGSWQMPRQAKRRWRLRLQPDEASYVRALSEHRIDPTRIDLGQLHWLANLSLITLGEMAEPILAAIVEAGHSAHIPLDNRLAVLGP